MDQVNVDGGMQNAELENGKARPVRSAIRNPRSVMGYLFAAAGLVWVLHDIEPERLLGHLTDINWWWIAPALVCDALCYLCQGWRWSLLLRPAGNLSTLRATQAIYVGLFTNEVLPMRLGELVRGYLAARWMRLAFLAVIPSMIVERIFDGLWMAVGVGLTVAFVPLPRRLAQAGDLFGLAMVVVTLLFALIISCQRAAANEAPARQYRWRPLRLLSQLLRRLAEGMRGIPAFASLYPAFLLSFVFVLLEMLSFWLVMVGYGLALSFWAGAAVYLIIRLGTMIPNAPANVGAYQFFCVVGLKLFGVEKTLATGFSLVVFVLLTLPLLVIGFIALSRSGTTLFAIREEVSKLMNHRATP